MPFEPVSTEAYVALGANLGDRLSALHAACVHLAATPGVSLAACSRVFASEAVAPEPQPPYLNAVARISTRLDPRTLLAVCLAIERLLGRDRRSGRRWAARQLDLDLLLYGDRVIDEPGLHVPHPEIGVRPFVRAPLADVARSGLIHPISFQVLDRYAGDSDLRVYAAAPTLSLTR